MSEIHKHYTVKNLGDMSKFNGDFVNLTKDYGIWSNKANRFLKGKNSVELPKNLREHYGIKTISKNKMMMALVCNRDLFPLGDKITDFYSFCTHSNTLRNWLNEEITVYSIMLSKGAQELAGQQTMSRLLLSYWVHTGTRPESGTVRFGPKGFYLVDKGKSATYFNGNRRGKYYPGVSSRGSSWRVRINKKNYGTFDDYEEAVKVAKATRERIYGEAQSSDHVRGKFNRGDLPAIKPLVEEGKRKVYRKKVEGHQGVLRDKIGDKNV